MPPSQEETDFKFHAKPAPKFEAPHIEKKQPAVTVPQTPKFSEAGKASLKLWRRPRSRVNKILKYKHLSIIFILIIVTVKWQPYS